MESLLTHLTSLTPGSVYLTLAGILLLCGLGVPIPEDISLISAGYLAYLGIIDVHVGFAVCFSAVLAGDTLAFFLGRWFGQRILAGRFARRFFKPRKQLRVRAYFRKYGSKVTFVGRFLPGLRFSIFFSAGTLHMRTAVFFIYDTLAAAISVPVLVYLAWYFGEHLDHVVQYARRTEHGIAILIVIAAGIVAIRAWRKRRQKGRAAAAAAAAAAVEPGGAVATGVAFPPVGPPPTE